MLAGLCPKNSMTFFAASVSSPPPKPSNSDMDDGDYESEYEEIEEEIEEEDVEVEEEIEEEVEEDGDSMIGEDVTPVRLESHEDGTDHILEPEKHGEHREPSSMIPIISAPHQPRDIHTFLKGERSSIHNEPKAPFGDWGQLDIKQVSPRLHVPQIRLRSSSSAEFDGENKRPRVGCVFYAKGWCIKGNSCRFPHIKEASDAVPKKSEFEREAFIESRQCRENQILYGATRKLVLHEHDNRHETGSSTFGTPLEEIKKGDMVGSGCWSGSYSRSMQPSSFGSFARNTNVFRTPNILGSSIEHRTSISSSLSERTPALNGSESEIRSRDHFLRGTEPANYNIKTFSDDWEPSVSFCPSHIITWNLLYEESSRDSISQDVRDGQVNFSYSARRSSPLNVHLQLNKPPEKDTNLVSFHVGSTGKDTIVNSNWDNKLSIDKRRHAAELKIGGSGAETEVISKKVVSVQNDSKALEYFRAELIEFVKELLKPTWREGLISREAHKTIVKKTVDKVLRTLEPDQIPSSPESTKLYISSSQPKLAMVVEGYIDKYGKF